MPGEDGTGPMGTGARGLGLGPCGRGMRRGGGRCFRMGVSGLASLSKEEEEKILKAELVQIELEKKQVETRINEINK